MKDYVNVARQIKQQNRGYKYIQAKQINNITTERTKSADPIDMQQTPIQ